MVTEDKDFRSGAQIQPEENKNAKPRLEMKNRIEHFRSGESMHEMQK
jgi:hypothetical protein